MNKSKYQIVIEGPNIIITRNGITSNGVEYQTIIEAISKQDAIELNKALSDALGELCDISF